MRGCGTGRSLGNNRSGGGLRRNRGRRRRGNDPGFLPHRRHNLARLRACRRGRRMRRNHHGRSLLGRRLGRGWRRRLCRSMAPARCQFVFLLFGKDRLQRIAWLRNMREVDLRLYALMCPRGARRRCGRPARGMPEMRTHPIGFVRLKRTGMGLCLGHAEFRKDIQNRARLHFQLTCEIVNSYLAHPPLFGVCYQKP